MNWRHKLADWISGGELTDVYQLARSQQERLDAMDRALRKEIGAGLDLGVALRRIADMETSGANATVRRMAATAKGALKNGA